ncbi:MAG: amino acid adenylation domain-containing protein [Polyangiales bacterium]
MNRDAVNLGPGVIDQFELTPMQHGMLFESVLSDRPWLNVEQIVIRMDEELDPEMLRQAWRAVQKRHASLRTSFRWAGLDVPLQHIHSDAPLRYDPHDWRNLSVVQQNTKLQAFIEADRQAGVKLDEAAPMRLNLFRCADTSWTLVWTFHHAILDGRGFTLVLEEAFHAYEQLRKGERPDISPTTTMRPHLEALRHRDVPGAKAFFQELLQGCEITTLPVEHSRSGTQQQREFADTISTQVTRGLERLSDATNTTLYTCLQAGWGITLARYVGAGDVVFGSTRSGRHTFAEAKHTAGCFINTLPVRALIGDDDTVGELVGRLREQSIGLREHEHTPLVDIQRWCGQPGEAPLTTNVVFERYYLDARLRANGGAWKNRRTTLLEQGSIPLTLALYLSDDGLDVHIEYDSSRYDEASIKRLHKHFSNVLSHLARADSDTRIETISLLGDNEREELLAFGRPSNPIRRDGTTYVEAFAAQVKRSPDSIALRSVDSTDALSYAELDRRSDDIARRLKAQGVERGHRVAVCLPRSTELAVSILGVLKSGAAYIPLDPAYPTAALTHMLEDSAAQVVLTRRDVARSLVLTTQNTLFVEDAPTGSVDSGESDDTVTPSITDSDPAYIIYTSGSTGMPKGVVVSHGALVAHNRAAASLFELEATDQCLQFASFSFDVAIEEMLPTWLSGATLVLRNQAMSESVSEFLKQTEDAAITVLNIPTAFWHELAIQMDERSLALPKSVRLVVVGGEKALRVVRDLWARLVPDVRWLNGYGPTETTITCTTFDALAEELEDDQEIPIGRPTRNATAYVLGPRMRPVPVGVFGELFIGGASVANGYLGAPEKSAKCFIDDVAFSGERVYASGDRCRWLPSGCLEFAGRVDRQLKVRGFRIEPGEIERALEMFENVEEALVALSPEKQLVAWLRTSKQLDEAEVRRRLRGRLPLHMVPAAYVCMTSFPRTPGGKIDRAQLPAPKLAESGVSEEPRHDTDRTLCALFAQALGLPNVRPNDSFFDLGGQSLVAIRLLDSIEGKLGTRPSLAALRMSPSPAELADWMSEKGDEEGWQYVYPIQPAGSKPPFFAIHVLGTNGALFTPLAECLGPDQPVVGLAVALREEGARTEVVDVAGGYVDEIMRYAPEGPIAIGAVSLGGLVAFEVAHELRARGREVGLVALFDALAPGSLDSVGLRQRIRLHAREIIRSGGITYFKEKAMSRVIRARELFDRVQLRVKRTLGVEVGEELRILEFIDDNASAAHMYMMRPYPGKLTLFRATQDIFYSKAYKESALGWRAHADDVDVIDVPGDHLSMLLPPHAATLAEHLDAELRRLRGD